MEIRPHPANQELSPHALNAQYRAIVTYENRSERHRVGWLAPWLSLERYREALEREVNFLFKNPEYPYDVTVSHKTLSRMAAKLLIDPPQLIGPKGEQAEGVLNVITTYFDESKQAREAAMQALAPEPVS